MYQIRTFNNIASQGLDLLDKSYALNESNNYDGILLRSQNLHKMEFSPSLKAIARAGAGVNNIPLERCSEEGIVVFNTPGANANAVKELVLASMLLSVRPIFKGAQWVQTLEGEDISSQVEANKKQFAGTELDGKTLGVIGLGSIGSLVANDAYRLGMNVLGYDPYVSVNTAWNISRRVHRALSLEEVLSQSDFVSLHVPLLSQTKNLISAHQLAKMKDDAVLLNFSRGGLVDDDAVVDALNNNTLRAYYTDFAKASLLHNDKITVLPHLGASTEEAEINCAKAAVKTLQYFLETGNIVNSVNFPNVELSLTSPTRFTLIHKNIPNMLGQISSVAAEHKVNIDNMINKNSGDYAYTIVDINETDETLINDLNASFIQIDSIIKTRVINNS